MAQQHPAPVSAGDLVYDLDCQIAGITDFGITLEEVLSGSPLPPGGVRLDVAVEGKVTGLLSGQFSAVDYLYVRPDGRFELHVHGVITTDDGARVAISAVGAGTPVGDGTARILEYVSAYTSFEQYTWINTVALRVEGTLVLATGAITLQITAA
jgi:hypothetical protein